MKTSTLILLIIIFGILLALMLSLRNTLQALHRPPVVVSQETTVSYSCDQGKSISATYAVGEQSTPVDPGMPPTPTGSVHIELSDGRTLELPQTISGSGIRYANADESVIFWSKGETAFLMEADKETYTNCISQAALQQ